MVSPSYRQHEVQFCAEVSKWADRLFEQNSELAFGSSDIESFGRGSRKRQDFRVYERKPKGKRQDRSVRGSEAAGDTTGALSV